MSFDPVDWPAFRRLAHRALDEACDDLAHIAEQPAWRAVPPDVKTAIAEPLPRRGELLDAVYERYRVTIAPYTVGNRHPRFFGWVHGAGTPAGMVAEMLAGALDINTGGREHAAVYLERRVIAWFAEIFGFPPESSGIVTSGSSLSNLIALLVARNAHDERIRRDGVSGRLTAYASREAHSSVARAFDIAGLGSASLRDVAVDTERRIAIDALVQAIAADRAAGYTPFFLCGTAGSAATGATDDLRALAAIAREEQLWFHVDGAFGALAQLSASERHRVAGIAQADSLAFDAHKWLHVPYDAGCVLVRDATLHRAAFAGDVPYLGRSERGTAAGDPWYYDFGPELSRGFRALKLWFTLKTIGLDALGAMIGAQCAIARAAGARIAMTPGLHLLAPVGLNIVVFRSEPPALASDEAALDAHNAELAIVLQEDGTAVLSTTRIDGRLALRMNIMNHRTTPEDVEQTIDAVVAAANAGGSARFPRV